MDSSTFWLWRNNSYLWLALLFDCAILLVVITWTYRIVFKMIWLFLRSEVHRYCTVCLFDFVVDVLISKRIDLLLSWSCKTKYPWSEKELAIRVYFTFHFIKYGIFGVVFELLSAKVHLKRFTSTLWCKRRRRLIGYWVFTCLQIVSSNTRKSITAFTKFTNFGKKNTASFIL